MVNGYIQMLFTSCSNLFESEARFLRYPLTDLYTVGVEARAGRLAELVVR